DANEVPSGTGHSYLDLPGKTPFTKGSELENAETSAVGRALVMAGIPSSSLASDFEVAMKAGPTTGAAGPQTTATMGGGGPGGREGVAPPPATPTLSPQQVKAVRDVFPSPAAAMAAAREYVDPELPSLSHLTPEQATLLVAIAEEKAQDEEPGGGYG